MVTIAYCDWRGRNNGAGKLDTIRQINCQVTQSLIVIAYSVEWEAYSKELSQNFLWNTEEN